ncbi:MAG: DinB family protein [Candidatus Zixiibacteriota bacterium]|nr:MAG: DinB family protein [candidate division Zixibacteria bacterium]
MESRFNWFARKFKFDLPPEIFPMVVERLRGTPVRLEEMTKSLPQGILTRRPKETWTILENVGHLWDLEPLWDGRIDDFLEGKERLRAADSINKKTDDANHNAASLDTLLGSFRTAREAMVARFDAMEENQVSLTALHPRLDQPMRMIDLAIFIAEHDDHHLARITDLARKFAG